MLSKRPNVIAEYAVDKVGPDPGAAWHSLLQLLQPMLQRSSSQVQMLRDA